MEGLFECFKHKHFFSPLYKKYSPTMLIKPLIIATSFYAIVAFTSPTGSALLEYTQNLPKSVSKHQGTRPKIAFSPKQPYKPFKVSPPRGKNCYVSSHNDGVTDDSPFIMDAVNKCNPGGHVIFSQGTKYVIGTALDLSNLNHVDLGKLHAEMFPA